MALRARHAIWLLLVALAASAVGVWLFRARRGPNQELRTAFLIVTHNHAIASRCRRVVRLVDGRIVADGEPAAVLGKAEVSQ